MKNLLKRYGPAVSSGLLLGMAFPKWHLWPLAWVALAPLFCQAWNGRVLENFKRGFLSGFVFYLFLFQWLMTNVYWAGGWAFIGYVTVSAILGAYWGVMLGLWTWLRVRVPALGNALVMACLWAAMEFGQSRLFTGFGWGAAGYSQGANAGVLQLASLGSVFSISFVLALFNGLLAEAIMVRGTRRLVAILCGVAVVVGAHAVGSNLVEEADNDLMPLTVGLLQTDFPLEMKWDREYAVEMVRSAADKSMQITERDPVDLFVWPEAMITEEITFPGIAEIVKDLVTKTGAFLFTGVERYDKASDTYPNASCLVNPEGEVVDFYDKVHLVPFGEYMPFAKYLPFARQVVPAVGEVGFGSKQKVFEADNRRFGPLICFEVLFPELAEKLLGMGADYLIVITNLGWFGSSAAIPQEFELARMRAVETRLPLVHCANTGITGVFDPWGRFNMVHGAFDRNGKMFVFGGDVTPETTIMFRVGGSLPVPAPARRLIPRGPALFPWVMVGACALMLFAAAIGRKRQTGDPLPKQKAGR